MLGVMVVAACAGAGLWLRHDRALAAASKNQVRLLEPEIDECQQRLRAFHTAWSRYRRDHKGQEPPSFEAMIPRYIHDPHVLVCPTAERWQRQGHAVPHGSIKIGGKEYPVTYGFLWLAAGYPRLLKREGERAPLAVCRVHRSVFYAAVYRSPPPMGGSGEGGEQSVPAAAGVLVIRRDGEIGLLDDDER